MCSVLCFLAFYLLNNLEKMHHSFYIDNTKKSFLSIKSAN